MTFTGISIVYANPGKAGHVPDLIGPVETVQSLEAVELALAVESPTPAPDSLKNASVGKEQSEQNKKLAELLTKTVGEARGLDSRGQYARAEALYRDSAELSRDLNGEQDIRTGDILLDLALNLSNQGKFDPADSIFRQAEAILQKSAFDADRARLAQYQSYHFANQGLFAKGRKASEQASELWRKMASGVGANRSLGVGDEAAQDRSAEKGELAMSLNFQAKMALRQDEIFTAQALAGEALQTFGTANGLPGYWRASILQTLGEISIAQRRTSAAETYFKLAYDLRLAEFGVSRPTVQTLSELGRAYQTDGLDTSAIITFRKAFSEAKSLTNSRDAFSTEQLVSFGSAIVDYSERLKTEDELQGLYAEAFDAFQFNRSSVLEQTIQKAKRRMEVDDPELRKGLEKLDQAFRDMTETREKIRAQQEKPPENRDATLISNLQEDFERLHGIWVVQQQALGKEFPQLTASTAVPALKLQDVRSRLDDGEGLINFIIGRNTSIVQLIRKEGSWVGRVNAGVKDLQERVTGLRKALEVQAGTITEFDLNLSYDLYKVLLGEMEPRLKGLDRLIVIPEGPLASLPFAVLVTDQPKSTDYLEAKWLISRFALSQAPSIASLLNLRGLVNAHKPTKELLAFGDPMLLGPKDSNTKPNGKAMVADAGRANATSPDACRPEGPMSAETLLAMNPLPDTAKELTQIATLFDKGKTDVFLGKEATEAMFRKQSLSDYRVVYLATHGLLPQELKCQSEPGLVLTPPKPQSNDRANDGLLDASEIATLSINADLVVLSACNTAGAGKMGGEALSGLGEAFFFGGARSLVVSHWQVPSSATASLMTRMFAKLADKTQRTGPAESLRQAQMALAAGPQTAHPFFWGAFVVVGDGRDAIQ